MVCQDDRDTDVYVSGAVVEGDVIIIDVDLESTAWNDAGPRHGIDFIARESDGSASGAGSWGPTKGYSFHIADSHDAHDGKCLVGDTDGHGDDCPTIGKDGGGSSFTLLAIGQYETREGSYHLHIEMHEGGIEFELQAGGTNNLLVRMATRDTTYRSGYVAFHCTEGERK